MDAAGRGTTHYHFHLLTLYLQKQCEAAGQAATCAPGKYGPACLPAFLPAGASMVEIPAGAAGKISS